MNTPPPQSNHLNGYPPVPPQQAFTPNTNYRNHSPHSNALPSHSVSINSSSLTVPIPTSSASYDTHRPSQKGSGHKIYVNPAKIASLAATFGGIHGFGGVKIGLNEKSKGGILPFQTMSNHERGSKVMSNQTNPSGPSDVIVRDLSPNSTDSSLRTAFSSVVPIISMKRLSDSSFQLSFRDPEHALILKRRFNRTVVDGNRITIELVK